MQIIHENDTEKGIFRLMDGNEEAGYMSYQWKDGIIDIDHTKVHETYSGQGLAQKLLSKAVEYARENSIKIIPTCSFVKKVMERDERYQDVLN